MNNSGLSNDSQGHKRGKSGRRPMAALKKLNYRTTDEEIEQISQQEKILNHDRQKLHEVAVSTQNKNRETIEQIAQEIKDIEKINQDAMAEKKARHSAGMGKTAKDFGGEDQKSRFFKNQYDALHEKVKLQNKLLMNLQDKLQEVSGVKNAASDENPLTKQIRILENKLDKIMIKYNEAQSIRKTYEQIVKRLKEERIGYDNQLAAIERSLKGKEHDYVELLLLSHDATHAKELAISELRKYELKKHAVANLRKKYLQEKRKQIENKKVAMPTQHTTKDMFEHHHMGHDDVKNSDSPNMYQEYNHTDYNNIKSEIDDYSEGRDELLKIAGEKDVSDVINKYKTQGETIQILKGLERTYTEEHEKLIKERKKFKDELHYLKYGGTETRGRQQIDEIEKSANKTSLKCERLNLKYQRISKILIDVRAGIEHLNTMIGAHLKDRPDVKFTEENLPDRLRMISDTVKGIYNTVKYSEEFQSKQGRGNLNGQRALLNDYVDQGLYDRSAAVNRIERNHTDMEDEELSDSQDDVELDASGSRAGRDSSRRKR